MKTIYKEIHRITILLEEMNEQGMVESINQEMEWNPYEVINIETDYNPNSNFTSFSVWVWTF